MHVYDTCGMSYFFKSVKSELALETINIRRRLFLGGEVGSKLAEFADKWYLVKKLPMEGCRGQKL